MRQTACFSDNNYQKFPIIGSNNNYWIKLSSIIGNPSAGRSQLLSEKTSRLRRKEETSLYKIILCGYLIINYLYNNHQLHNSKPYTIVV